MLGEGLLAVLVDRIDRVVLKKKLIQLVAFTEEAHVLARAPAAAKGRSESAL